MLQNCTEFEIVHFDCTVLFKLLFGGFWKLENGGVCALSHRFDLWHSRAYFGYSHERFDLRLGYARVWLSGSRGV